MSSFSSDCSERAQVLPGLADGLFDQSSGEVLLFGEHASPLLSAAASADAMSGVVLGIDQPFVGIGPQPAVERPAQRRRARRDRPSPGPSRTASSHRDRFVRAASRSLDGSREERLDFPDDRLRVQRRPAPRASCARSARWASAAGSGSGTRRRRASFAIASHSSGASTPSRFIVVSIRNASASSSRARFMSASFLKSRARRSAQRAHCFRVSAVLCPQSLHAVFQPIEIAGDRFELAHVADQTRPVAPEHALNERRRRLARRDASSAERGMSHSFASIGAHRDRLPVRGT